MLADLKALPKHGMRGAPPFRECPAMMPLHSKAHEEDLWQPQQAIAGGRQCPLPPPMSDEGATCGLGPGRLQRGNRLLPCEGAHGAGQVPRVVACNAAARARHVGIAHAHIHSPAGCSAPAAIITQVLRLVRLVTTHVCIRYHVMHALNVTCNGAAQPNMWSNVSEQGPLYRPCYVAHVS